MIPLTSDNKLKFGDIGHQKFELYEAVFRSPSCGATIEATGEEVLRINPLQPEPEAPGRLGWYHPLLFSNSSAGEPGSEAKKPMKLNRSVFFLLGVILLAGNVLAQDRSTGGLKGKVKVETGTPAGVAVVVRQGEREVARGLTDKKGEFLVSRLSPGRYGVTIRKSGLSVGTLENIEVQAGKTRSIGDNLVLAIDEGSIAFIRGSIFNEDGRSVPNVRIELAKIQEDGTVKKIDGRVSNEIGAFVFRLTPDPGKYRVTAKPGGAEPVSKDVEVDGPAVYRIALSIKPPAK